MGRATAKQRRKLYALIHDGSLTQKHDGPIVVEELEFGDAMRLIEVGEGRRSTLGFAAPQAPAPSAELLKELLAEARAGMRHGSTCHPSEGRCECGDLHKRIDEALAGNPAPLRPSAYRVRVWRPPSSDPGVRPGRILLGKLLVSATSKESLRNAIHPSYDVEVTEVDPIPMSELPSAWRDGTA